MHYTLIQNARIIDPEKRKSEDADIVVSHSESGDRIDAIWPRIDPKSLRPATVTVINAKGNAVLPAFTDLSVTLREPGAMYKEDIASTCRAAASGGYHQLLTYFEPDSRYSPTDALAYMQVAFDRAPIGLYPVAGIGSLSGRKLLSAGAVTLTDRYCPPKTDGELFAAMECCAEEGITFMASSYEATLTLGGTANSGIASMMGLKGISSTCESLAVIRAILLSKEAGCRLHLSGVSTKEALWVIRQAKEKGLPVTCDVSLYHLYFEESEVIYHGNTAKMMPPLRSYEDKEAVLAAIADGTVDAIASHHAPHDKKDLECAFADAPFGAVGLECVFPVCVETLIASGRIDVFHLCRLLSLNPHRILYEAGAPIPEKVTPIAAGQPASFNLVSFDQGGKITEDSLRGRAKNTPLLGTYLRGRVERSFCHKGKA